jgi:hypothetical protein
MPSAGFRSDNLGRGQSCRVLLESLDAKKLRANWLGLIEENVIGRFVRFHFEFREFSKINKGKNCRDGSL